MQKTPKHFTHDALLTSVRTELSKGLKRYQVKDVKDSQFSNITCLMSGLALFTLKFSSLLQFDQQTRSGMIRAGSIKNLFQIKTVPCDTYMRERLDRVDPAVCRQAFTRLLALLQRAHLLDHFQFMGHYLISLDGTGVFSSPTIHCENCCVKEHRNGSKTYYHHILGAALVHPDQRVVYPLAPEPIMKTDGVQKNDCERNAAKRWIADFRREHPHLKAIILADGLSCTEPFIRLLEQNNLSYILVCKEGDHSYLTDWIGALDPQDSVTKEVTHQAATQTYKIMKNIPLKDGQDAPRVTVVSFQEQTTTQTKQWMWVTDLDVTLQNVDTFTKGARARWKVENETFNTLKNQGYQFEHNFGHGQQHLHTLLTYLMMLAFLIDQCLLTVNKRYQAALKKYGAKYALWEFMRNVIQIAILPDFETIYHIVVHPPPDVLIPSVMNI